MAPALRIYELGGGGPTLHASTQERFSPVGGIWGLRVMNEQLAKTRAGRVLLHVTCLLRCPRHAGWHWQGIIREFHLMATVHGKRAN